MSESTKSAVLAKCEDAKNHRDRWIPVGGDSHALGLEYFMDAISPYFQIGSPHHVICLKFNEETNSESIVWQLAAQILGIKKPEPIPLPQAIANIATDALGLPRVLAVASNQPLRPFDALLWEAWWNCAMMWGCSDEAEVKDDVYQGQFLPWLATLPPDTIKADRELVVDFIIDGHLSFCLGNAGMPVDLMRKITSAIKRLAGMEVKNG
jgi:hypothetical protein